MRERPESGGGEERPTEEGDAQSYQVRWEGRTSAQHRKLGVGDVGKTEELRFEDDRAWGTRMIRGF